MEVTVYDASSLAPAASLTVGRGAIGAFSIPGSGGGESEKFLVVSENGISILNADFSPRGTLFLPTRSLPAAAALSHDRSLLAVAAGQTLFLIDTSTETIRAEIELGFEAVGLAVRGDSRRVYLIPARAGHVRVVDIEAGELRETALLLPEPPGAITTAADGSRVYVSTRGAIYALDERAETFFTPLPIAAAGNEKSRNLPGSFEAAGAQPLIDRLLVAARGLFFLRSGEKWMRGVLGSAPTAGGRVLAPDEIPDGVADLTASPDGRLLYLLTETGRLVRWDTAADAPTAETALASSPDAVSLTSPPIAQEGSLNKFSGDEQIVRSGSSFAVVAQALSDGGNPQPEVVVNLVGTFPGAAASCDNPLVATDSEGLVVFSCDASVVGDLSSESILIVDSFGRAPTAPFTVSIVPLVPGREGLQKLTGDAQVVTEGESFSTTFKVTDFVSTVAQEGAVISVSSEPSGTVSCVTSNGGLVDSSGEASFTCSALGVAENTVVLISVSDDGGRTIGDPFAATIVNEDVPISGLTKLSGDNQTVLQNSAFPEPLRVADRVAGEPQEDAVLTVSAIPGGVVSCNSGVLTDSSGVGTISCTAGVVGSTTAVQIFVSDDFLQELDVPFSATILSEAPTEEGLLKVSGDNQVAPRNATLPVPLVVSAVLDGEPQADLELSVSTTDQFLLLCPVSVMTGPNGLASITCNTGSVVVPTDVQVLVSDDFGRSLPSPFRVTVVPTSSEDVDSLILLTDDFLEVLVGETVEDAIEVLALDVDEDPVAGAAIFFSSDRGATFDPVVGLTGFNGRAETSVTFGCSSGLGSIDIALEPDGDPVLSVEFRASRGPAGLITKAQGDNQSGSPGQLLNQVALVARVTDICENAVQGASVTWSVEPPEAAMLVNTIGTTDGQGRASTLVRLGNRPGPFTITATSGSMTAVFNLTVEVDATQLAIVSGNNQTLALGEIAAFPLVVEARDDNNQGVPGVEITFAVVQGSATITTETTVTTNSLGRAQASVRAGAVLGTIRIAASAVGRNVSFTLNTIGRLPQVTTLGFVNGASFRQGWVPGSAGSIFGVELMEGVNGAVLPREFPFSTILRGVRVRINGVAAPILGLANVNGQEQINVQVPFGLTAPSTATVRIENNGAQSTVRGVPLFPVQPGIFENRRDGVRIAAALHPDFSLVEPSNPARRGKVVLLFLTGLGLTDPEVATNVPGPVPAARSVVSPVVGIDDEGVEVLGSFYAPELISAYQINFRVPTDAQLGNRKLSVVSGGVASQDTLLPIGP